MILEQSKSLDSIYQAKPRFLDIYGPSPALLFFGSTSLLVDHYKVVGGALEILGQSLQASAPALAQALEIDKIESATKEKNYKRQFTRFSMAVKSYKEKFAGSEHLI